jgi:hypothetical protein
MCGSRSSATRVCVCSGFVSASRIVTVTRTRQAGPKDWLGMFGATELRHRPVAEQAAHDLMFERPETRQYGN